MAGAESVCVWGRVRPEGAAGQARSCVHGEDFGLDSEGLKLTDFHRIFLAAEWETDCVGKSRNGRQSETAIL